MPYRDPNYKTKYKADRIAYLTSLGLCNHCGKTEPSPGHKRCDVCRKYNAKRVNERYKQWKEEGRCVRCGNPNPREGKVLCGPCQRKGTASQRRMYRKRRKEARCLKCGGDIDYEREGGNYCSKCHATYQIRNSKKTQRQIANNLCAKCECQLPEGFKYRRCDPCRKVTADKAIAKRNKLKAQFKCERCEAKLTTVNIGNGHTSCDICRHKAVLRTARRKLRKAQEAQMVK